ncbi:uncharacterized protein LOC6577900 [Drosophila mojavensis]|uniref:Uncharacterized protein n=1 Tax=Drosophila mojavensis TaxID=7230 RepID=B4KH56_DROMO|nr:uncharacterized protein LOC6577900 [Drosophila mojavensis]EDW13273.1 uncharacterized protein Dmoj_GI18119 [Drosophila mojavensis]
MVYTERTDKCLTSSKESAGKQDKSQSKYQSSFSSRSGSSSSSSSGAWSSQASSDEKWKYNNMVKDNRDQFNGMHFS